MKILVVASLFPPPTRGGAERVAELNARGAAALGHEVVVLTTAPFREVGFRLQHHSEGGVTVYRFFPLNIGWFGSLGRYGWIHRFVWFMLDCCNLHAYVVARRVVAMVQPDIIITHNLRGLGYFLPRLFAQRTTRSLHVVHDVQLLEPSGILYPRTAERILGRISRRCYRFFSAAAFRSTPSIVFPSHYLSELHRRYQFWPKSQQTVLANPIFVNQENPKPHRGVNVLFVGPLEEQKGIAVLLSAWQRLKANAATLHVVGDGSLSYLLRQAGPSVIYHGRLGGADLEELWNEADVLVQPSLLIENSPVNIAEALARGITIVASDVGGIAELAGQSACTRLVRPGDEIALTRALNQAVRERIGGVAPELVSLPTPEEYVSALIALTDSKHVV